MRPQPFGELGHGQDGNVKLCLDRQNVAIALAKDELIVGLGAQRPYDQGVTEARLAAGALLGKTAAPYVALAALPGGGRKP
mgnify:CR=1 FL=1